MFNIKYNQKHDKLQQNSLKKGLVTGCCVTGEMLIGSLFLENMKLEKQRTSLPYSTIKNNLFKQGIRGYYSGFLPWGILIGFGKGVVINSSTPVIRNYCKNYEITPYYTNLLSGFLGGAAQGLYMSPLMLARIRINENMVTRSMSNNTNNSLFNEVKTSFLILYNVAKNEGIFRLFKGTPIMMLKRSFDWTTRFYLVDRIRTNIIKPNEELTEIQKIYSAFLGGCVSVMVTTPVDRLIPMILQSKKVSLLENLKTKYQKEGISTMFRGGSVRMLQTGIHTLTIMVVSDKVYKWLYE
jgi:hypothetical protein